jgi:hypothetical protein
MNDTAIVRQQDAQIVTPQDAEEMREIRKKADVIRAALGKNAGDLSDTEAMAAAAFGKSSGQSIFEGDYYAVAGMGVVPGYRGEQKKANDADGNYVLQHRTPTTQEIEENEIKTGDILVVTEIYQPHKMQQAVKMGLHYQPIVGIGIVRKADKWISYEWKTAQSGKRYKAALPEDKWTTPVDPPVGRSWHWKATKRADKDALRQIAGVSATAREALAKAEAEDVDLSPEVKEHGTREQIIAATEQAQRPTTPGPKVDLGSSPAGFQGYSEDSDIVEGEIIPHDGPGGQPEYETQGNLDVLKEASHDAEFTAIPAAPLSVSNQPAPKPAPVANGKAKQASVQAGIFKLFDEMCIALATTHPHYATKDGLPDKFHILMGAGACGHSLIGPENIQQVFAELADRAEAQA